MAGPVADEATASYFAIVVMLYLMLQGAPFENYEPGEIDLISIDSPCSTTGHLVNRGRCMASCHHPLVLMALPATLSTTPTRDLVKVRDNWRGGPDARGRVLFADKSVRTTDGRVPVADGRVLLAGSPHIGKLAGIYSLRLPTTRRPRP